MSNRKSKACCPLVRSLREIICAEPDHTKLPADKIAAVLQAVTLTPEYVPPCP